MKKLTLVLALLFAAQSYGVYGAAQAQRLTMDCHLAVSVLCYDWRPNRLGEVLGEERAGRFEEKLKELEEAWQKDVVDRVKDPEKPDGFDDVLDRIGELGQQGLDKAREAADRVLGGGEP